MPDKMKTYEDRQGMITSQRLRILETAFANIEDRLSALEAGRPSIVRKLTCPGCGSEITTTDRRKKYCSRTCKSKVLMRRHRERKAGKG